MSPIESTKNSDRSYDWYRGAALRPRQAGKIQGSAGGIVRVSPNLAWAEAKSSGVGVRDPSCRDYLRAEPPTVGTQNSTGRRQWFS